MEHRQSVLSFQRCLCLASSRSSAKDLSVSANTVRLQVVLERPRDLLPCGFHSNALWQISFWLFRRVCPIQPYFLLLISTFMSDCSVLSHSSWLVIISVHLPRYKKSSTRSIASSPILKASVVLLFTRRSLVFEMLTLSPTRWDSLTKSSSLACMFLKLCDKKHGWKILKHGFDKFFNREILIWF